MSPADRNPALAEKISQLRLKIAPILSVSSGYPHPEFPPTLLHLFLLTEDQLDSLADYYSQIHPDATTFMYPQTMGWNQDLLRRPIANENSRDGEPQLDDLDRIAIKRRKFAKFIGMKGTETPLWEVETHIHMLGERIKRCLEKEERLLARKPS